MTSSAKPAKGLHYTLGTAAPANRNRSPSDRPSMPAAFSRCPESRRIMEEMIFNDRFQDEYAAVTRMVGVNEVTAVCSTNLYPCIGTSSLASCIGIAVYDADAKIGAVAHVLIAPEDPSFESVVRMLEKAIEAADLLGGRKYALYTFNGRQKDAARDNALGAALGQALETLMRSGKVGRCEPRQEHNFVLDTRSGDIFTADTN